jgi:hypothetical protein
LSADACFALRCLLALDTVDMDHDGDLDALVAGEKTHNVAWYENPLATAAVLKD